MTRPLTTAEVRTRRGDFPSLERRMNDRPLVYLDGPAGTQVPRLVIDAITSYYTTCNANSHGSSPRANPTRSSRGQGARWRISSVLPPPTRSRSAQI
jgi:selenocysteine lyase/cysteine desulfurase